MASLLPNGKQTFINPTTGMPLAGGLVYFYIPSTLTPKTTYQDQGLTTPNSNPVVLDAGGSAVIWGSGSYRQILKDSLGNQIWDAITSETTTQSSYSSGTYTGTITGATTAPTVTVGWQKAGNLITISLPPMNAVTSNASTFSITGGPPDIATSGVWENGNVILSPCFSGKNNSATVTNVQAYVDVNGAIIFCSATSSAINPNPYGWQSSGSKCYGNGATSAPQYPSGITFSYLDY